MNRCFVGRICAPTKWKACRRTTSDRILRQGECIRRRSSGRSSSRRGEGAPPKDASAVVVEQKVRDAIHALEDAEDALSDLERLDVEDSRFRALHRLRKLGSLLLFSGSVGLLCSLEGMAQWVRYLVSGIAALAIGLRGYSKGSLSKDGCVAAVFVGAVTFSTSFAFGFVLLFFFLSSSSLTKLKQDVKAKVEKDFKPNGQRNAVQVLANGGIPTLVALAMSAFAWEASAKKFLTGMFVGYYACCNADTWSSEIGVLSPYDPRLVIPPWRRVQRGTNGGVSAYGTLASVAGALGIGVVFAATASGLSLRERLAALALTAAAGTLGSLIDSVLGATLQFSGLETATMKVSNRPGEGIVRIAGLGFLNNDAVNALSAAITALLAGLAFKTLL